MSVEEKIKLNLKALNPKKIDDVDISESIEKTESSHEDTILDEEISTPKWEETAPEIALTNDSKPKTSNVKISFADIKKQIDSKNIQENTESIPVATEDIKEKMQELPRVEPQQDSKKEIASSEDTTPSLSLKKIWVTETKQDNIDLGDSETTDTIPEFNNSSEKIESHKDPINNPVQDTTDDILVVEWENQDNQRVWKTQDSKPDWVQENKNTKKKSLFSLFKRKWKKEVQKLQEIDKNNTTETEKGEKIHFANYESYFKKESTNFLKKFQNFKYTPSTRVWLLLSLISMTVIIISSLMIFFPEKHSLDIYKASIFDTQWENQEQDSSFSTPNTANPVQETSEEIEQIIVLENEIEDEKDIPKSLEQLLIAERNKAKNETNISKEEKSREILKNHLLKTYK